jgi:hypothetical protein
VTAVRHLVHAVDGSSDTLLECVSGGVQVVDQEHLRPRRILLHPDCQETVVRASSVEQLALVDQPMDEAKRPSVGTSSKPRPGLPPRQVFLELVLGSSLVSNIAGCLVPVGT